jgi:putative hydrolase of the HAD superfamily
MGGYLRELGIEDAFDVIVISGDEGITKPDLEIYHRALGRLDVAAREAVFIDDMRENVEAARRVRLRATRFRGTAPLYGWLQSLGISLPERRFDAVPDVRAVIFDWGGVMEELPSEDDVAAWERRLGLGSGVLPDVLWGKTWRRLSVGAISDEEYADDVANRLGLPGRDEALSFLQVFYTRDRLNDAIVRAARSLRERYKVALLSNAFPGQVETILKHHDLDIHAEFDVYVNSALVGVSKPDPRIYQIALERLDVEPDQAVFLDDMVRNVDSARELGIHAIQFADPGRSLADLEKLLGHEIDA